jgi:hypothetical protein
MDDPANLRVWQPYGDRSRDGQVLTIVSLANTLEIGGMNDARRESEGRVKERSNSQSIRIAPPQREPAEDHRKRENAEQQRSA